ncbi:MAG: hypothetical protein PUP91_16295 [Rhizonema sp. PD37]|nr:hypothetical protein [Rhizonema sp. PD37]
MQKNAIATFSEAADEDESIPTPLPTPFGEEFTRFGLLCVQGCRGNSNCESVLFSRTLFSSAQKAASTR